MTTKLFERLVTKFSIKVNDLAKYLEISKATIYNYRNLDNFSDIPSDKQYKIFYLFGKETEQELQMVLDESDNDVLARYVNRISSILRDSVQSSKTSIVSVEELTLAVERLTHENATLQRQVAELGKLSALDNLTRAVVVEKLSSILSDATTAEVKEFIDYLTVFERYVLSAKTVNNVAGDKK